MIQQTVKTAVIVGLVLVVGTLVASLQVVEGAELLEWRVDELVRLAAFGVATILVFDLGMRLGDQQERPVLGSIGLSSLAMLLLFALAVFLLYWGVQEVLRPQWLDTLDLVFALAMVGLAGAVLWRIYTDFEEIVETVKRRKEAREHARGTAGPEQSTEQAGTGAEAEPGGTRTGEPGAEFCTSCGAEIGAGQRFCGSCGTPVQGDSARDSGKRDRERT